MSKKLRLDQLMQAKGLADSLDRAKALIMAGSVTVNEQVCDKPGSTFDPNARIIVKNQKEYVGRGAYKLSGALKTFQIGVVDRVCADVGSSTGGFTQILLEQGARKVFAIDVGYGELDWKLRSDPRVIVMERTNVRDLAKLDEPPSLVSVDLSFISLKIVLPVVRNWLTIDAEVIALVKPQFEARREEVEEGGIVQNEAIHQRVIAEVLAVAGTCQFDFKQAVESSITGMHGNREYFIWLVAR